ncbi:hypothetical protein CAPTEDRAFT_2580 [Capitella teleta]|uniref:Kinesin motor domain-containing protein n=1 Tax=Capitella teleta TaxID=283909 RepID=R7UUY8_CAPTE|nr:hypothetical protein CAPTEDRAFT_2580 [Capitella teleta]|eukprot:ELU09990.1 hypothetical protein CAPTEDRAFT_2580 [Capitella teleta]
MAQLRETINRLEKQVSHLRADTKELNAQMEDLSGKLHAKEATIQDLRSTLQDRDSSIADLENTVAENKATILDLEAKLREGERMRKVLHNTVLELKGNIRVFCRVRPLLGEELAGVPGDDPDPQHIVFAFNCISFIELFFPLQSILSQTIRGPLGKGKYSFHFDQVFSPSSTQSVVFEEISQLVQSALDGYQVAIFAYGQTGSGKTFTMEGVQEDLEQRGMIPRSVEQVFASAEHLRQDGWKYELQVSFLEIYNEKIRDLLTNSKDQEVKHELKMVSPNSPEVMVTNLTYVKVNSPQQVFGLLKKASTNRAVAETKMNEHSSRSHSVFRLHLKGFNSVTHEKSAGCLNMIDLAGSERLKESKSEGERLKETKNINSSLANLGNVIMALANKDQHVPYRNSKLTHLLSNSLGGSSKVLMLLNLNPREECFSETLNSLRFATKVNNCNIGTAQKKTK